MRAEMTGQVRGPKAKARRNRERLRAFVSAAFPGSAGWTTLDLQTTGGLVGRNLPFPEYCRWELVDTADRNSERAILAALGTLVLAPVSARRLGRAILIPDSPRWTESAANVLLQAPHDLGLRVMAFRKEGGSIRVSGVGKWGNTWQLGGTDGCCPP
jgi:hypothetical protein